MQQRFFNLIREENKNGATVLFSSHILTEVQKLCTRVGIIKEGRMIRVEEISTMRNTTYKKVRLDFPAEIPADILSLAGISNVAQEASEVSFLFKGEIGTLIQTIGRFPLSNVQIEEPDLEEIFLHYYDKEA
jgi:ABC-2 type transport system ATP-binding protein